MARKKKVSNTPAAANIDAYIAGAGKIEQEEIVDTLDKNYMPYAMSVIVSRAFPEIDGFKPSHRKLLYTMYKMGLLTGGLTKSANIVGQTMRLNPHGDSAIYETMVRLARGNETLLHPYIQSKGNFGKAYSRDMAYAASRYTEAKLDPICNELFRDIDKNTVDFVPNYDNTMLEPTLFPATFPSILVNNNVGIGVSMASAVCSFNLTEVCETTIALIKNPAHNALDTLKGPDFPGGGLLLWDEKELGEIYKTGRGSVKLRAKYNYDKEARCLEILEIPATTTIEAIKEKMIALIKAGKIKEINDIRDETDINGLKIGIDIKKGVDPDALMQKLYKLTPLQDSYSCNFNILVHGYPKVMGVYDIIKEWTKFRTECIKRRTQFDLDKKEAKLHLLDGLSKILLDIDKAIGIIRETEKDEEVIPNLMTGFEIDKIQAEYIAEIKLRNLNKRYILDRLEESEKLEREINELKNILNDDKKVKNIIISELKDVIKKYGEPRKTQFFYPEDIDTAKVEEAVPEYPCTIFLSKSGYFKKITPQSLRMASEQKYKEGDDLLQQLETNNNSDVLFFTSAQQVYKSKLSAFEDTKASLLGDYVPAKLAFDSNEDIVYMANTADYSGYMIYIFENGKIAKVPMNSYETKTNRKKLNNAYSDKSKLIRMFYILADTDIMIKSTNGRAIVFNTSAISEKSSRTTQGVQAITLKAKSAVEDVFILTEEQKQEYAKFVVKNIPSAGSFLRNVADPEQLTLF